MVVRIRKGARPHVYMTEWMAHLDLSDERLAERMNRSRTTIYRWRNGDRSLTPQKVMEVAAAMGREDWRDLYRLPDRPSIDAVAAKVSKEDHQALFEMALRLARRAS